MQDAGIAWGRCGFDWQMIEATQGVYNWSTPDQVVAEANARGLHIYAGLGYCPLWASAGSDHRGPLNNPQDWYDFVYDCVSRYKDSIKYWELWNEPNLDNFWMGTRSQYIDQILKVGADAVHAADPTAKVCGPELAHLTSGDKDWYHWLRESIEQAGDKLDVVTHHCYKTPPSQVTSEMEKSTAFGDNPSLWNTVHPSVKEVLEYTGWFGKPFWLTETGWRSDEVGETTQGDYLQSLLNDWFSGQPNRAWMYKLFWYQIWEGADGEKWGLLYADETRKPSWYAYRDFVIGHLPPITISVDLNNPDVEDHVTHLQTTDGDTEPVTIGNRSCRKNVTPGQDNYFYFGVDDSLVYQGNRPNIYVMIDFYDTGSGSLALQYDASGGTYTDGGSVELRGTDTWKQFRFYVTDAWFGNRQNNGADFRIAKLGGGLFYLDVVQVLIQLPAGTPHAAFTAEPNIGPPPLQVNFDASDSIDPDGNIVDYDWEFGDNNIGSGITTSHTYTSGGIYVVTLTVTDNDGHYNTATTAITVFDTMGVSIDLGSPD
ncbi:MAG: PKD domain-containing protein, partial [Planctomycetota bacterium]